jgi:hypothetical protein
MLLTPPVTLHVKSDNAKLAIEYSPTRLSPNSLLDFEVNRSRKFRDICRMSMGQALLKGYCLVLLSRGFRKCVPTVLLMANPPVGMWLGCLGFQESPARCLGGRNGRPGGWAITQGQVENFTVVNIRKHNSGSRRVPTPTSP